jgi:ATP-dependent Lhr-like helicase
VAAERLPEIVAIYPDAAIADGIEAPAARAERAWTREAALVELLRGQLSTSGPITAGVLSARLSLASADITAALEALESEGAVLRGTFTTGTTGTAATNHIKGTSGLEWCERSLLARIHRYTLNRLRAEIEPVTVADYMRFLFVWQHVAAAAKLTGLDGVRALLAVLDGFEVPAAAWERAVLPARIDAYQPAMLDALCHGGEAAWARLSVPAARDGGRVVAATPIALFPREHATLWQAARGNGTPAAAAGLSDLARRVCETLAARGACFARDLAASCGAGDPDINDALAELVSAGLVASDGFAGLRAIVRAASSSRVDVSGVPGIAGRSATPSAGRWSLLRGSDDGPDTGAVVAAQAWALLRRYGVVFRRVLAREANMPPWRDLTRVFRRLEARGEIRGGRFVSGMAGEQFALPDAVERLREVRRSTATGQLITISAADPLNLTGILTSGERVRAIDANRIVYRDGIAIAALEGEYMRPLVPIDGAAAVGVATALTGRRMPDLTEGYVAQGVRRRAL